MSGGGLRGILLIAAIAILACAFLVVSADTGEGSVTGTPLPPWGQSWLVMSDTVATGETIRLLGNIQVISPYTLSLDGCTVIFNGTSDGEYGIFTMWGSTLYMNMTGGRATEIKVNTSSKSWYYNNEGTSYLSKAKLKDVYDGIDHEFGELLSIEGSTINAINRGIYARQNFHIGNSTLNVKRDTQDQRPSTYGIQAYSCTASIHNLNLNVIQDMNRTYNSSYSYVYSYVYGLYLSSVNVGKLSPDVGKEFKISVMNEVALENFYDYPYVTVRCYMYTYAIYLSGNTVCKQIKDVKLDIKESYYGAPYNATSDGRVDYYMRQRYIYSSIGSSGHAPIEVSGMTFKSLRPVFRTGGNTTSTYQGFDNYIMAFYDSSGARPADTVTRFHNLTFEDLEAQRIMHLPANAEFEVRDVNFKHLKTDRLISYEYGTMDYSISYNTFFNVTGRGSSSLLFYLRDPRGEGTIMKNTFDLMEGASLIYLHHPYDRTYIVENTFRRNTHWDWTWDNWIYFYSVQEKVTFEKNLIENNNAYAFIRSWTCAEKVVIENNIFRNNVLGDYLFRAYWPNAETELSENTFEGNTGPLFEIEWNWARFTFERNIVKDNQVGADYLLWTYYTYQELKITDNAFTNNTADGMMIYFQGATYWSSIPFSFERNTLSKNTASAALNGGIVVFKGHRYSLAIRRNIFDNNTGNCINFYHPVQGNPGWVHTVDGNYFFDNNGVATLWVDISYYTMSVKRNHGSGNTGQLVKLVMTDEYVYDNVYPNLYGWIRGPYNIYIENNNYSYNKGGAIWLHAQWHDTDTPFTLDAQSIRLVNNILRYNGDDWSIYVKYFGEEPTLFNNDVYGSMYGIYLEAIDWPVKFERLFWTIKDEKYDGGGPQGMTAWAFVNMDVEFYNCEFTQYKEALYAKDCQVDVWWCAIPEASGKTEGKGYIYVYNHLEFNVTWADATGQDSGMPAAGAKLALLGTNGRYYGAMFTDETGHIGPLLIQPWISVEGKMDQWSPYYATVILGGLTAESVVHAIGELMGENAVHLSIQDTVAPNLVVTSPSSGSTTNQVNLPSEGFLFETGSGVGSFQAWVDSGERMDIDPQEFWTVVFPTLEMGPHKLYFEVKDLAGNAFNLEMDISIDAMAPTLDITSPMDGEVTSESRLEVRGTYQDTVSDLSEIVVRINDEDYLPTSVGVIFEPIDLTEGVNTLVVEAIDKAGNRAVKRLTVTLDTYAPTLYVTSPLDGLVTREASTEVRGVSEAGTPIEVEVLHDDPSVDDFNTDAIAARDGSFLVELTLHEGRQTVVATAFDPAGNTRTVSRVVFLDTEPPGLTILSPTDPMTYTEQPTIELVGQIEDDDPDNVIVRINGIPVVQHLRFEKNLPLMEGTNTIIVTATDAVGNVVSKTVTVIRDTTKPDLTVDTPEDILTQVKMLEITGTVQGAEILRAAGATVNFAEDGRFSTTLDLSQAESPIVIEAEDMAGNTAEYSIAFVYDAVKPTLDVDTIPTETNSLVLYVNGTLSDDKTKMTTIVINGVMYPVVDNKFSAIVDLSTAADGYNNITLTAEDDAGNTISQVYPVHYTPEKIEVKKEEDETPNTALSWIGIIFVAAAVTLILTAWAVTRKGGE
jgi:hypothetical protein